MSEFFRFEVVDIDVIASTVEIARVIFLELNAVDHPGLAFHPLLGGVLIGVGIFKYQEQFFFVVGEVDRADASFEAGNLLRLTAVDEIEGPNLRFAAVACGDEVKFFPSRLNVGVQEETASAVIAMGSPPLVAIIQMRVFELFFS